MCLYVTRYGARVVGLWVAPTEDSSSGSHLESGGIALAQYVSVWRRSVCFRIATFHVSDICLSLFSPPSFLPSPVSAVQIVSFANLKKQVWMRGGGWRDELPAKEVVPPYSTYTSSALHPIVSLSSPAHLNKLAPLGVFCACACARMQKHTHVHAHSHSCKHLAMQARYGRMAARILCPVLSRHADTWSRTHTSSDVLIHFNASATTITHARFKANTLHWLAASY